ncbi:Cos4p [Saccharomyces cerevisiae x Saccharomyces kudriavzevii VIN7]|nr:Cos4p [Saccharomyces cerevisiae x Saccharomyces kudriavzevii VIN7]
MNMHTFQNLRGASMKTEHKMQFLSSIINEREIGADGWNHVAKRMNRYLFEQNVWKNEEFFFDGIDCQKFFKRNFVGLLSSKKTSSNVSLDVELWPYILEAQSSCTDESSVQI